MKRGSGYLKKRKGAAFLIEAILVCVLIGLMGSALTSVYAGQFTSLDASRTALQAQQLAETRANEIGVTPYANATTVASARAAVPSTTFEREVIVGAEVDLGGGSKKRDVTVNVYKPGEIQPRFTLLKTLTSQGSGSLDFHGKQKFTTSGTFTVPDGVTKVWVSGCGGGGGGGSGNLATEPQILGGGGGGAQSVQDQEITVVPGSEIVITIGNGGAGGTSGANGGNTSFGSLLILRGGYGALSGGNSGASGGLGGSSGGSGYTVYTASSGSAGGNTLFGFGALWGNAISYGTGGSGGNDFTHIKGWNGASGLLLVEW